MYVCNCNGVTEGEIRGAVDLGCASLDELRRELGVASCCRKCEPEARKLLAARCDSACAGHD